MKKDKAWLKEEIKVFQVGENMFTAEFNAGVQDALEYVQELIDQLDEPETLSQEWIDENKVARINDLRKMTTSDVVPVEKLKNLLVPKQDNGFVVFEKDKLDAEVQRMIDETYEAMNEKPVIPQFVADWDYENKEDALAYSIHPTRYSLEASYWNLMDRVRHSYEAEKEKKYRVIDRHEVYLLAKEEERNKVETVAELVEIYGHEYVELNYQLTEQEIKDYDERYWAFAEEVTE